MAEPTGDRWQEIDALFAAALDEPPAQREAFLERACRGDAELRRAVGALLQARARAEWFLETPLFTLAEGLDLERFTRGFEDGAAPGDPDAVGAAARLAETVNPERAVPDSPAPPRDLLGLAGRQLSHFQVQAVLSSGGMGVVYRAQDLRLGRTVALKFLLPQYSLDSAATERFLQEARAASRLDHPHICTIHEAGETEEGHLFLAMACYAGETLKAHLARTGVLPLEEAIEYARQIARGLEAAHAAGIVHRDLKPANLMRLSDGTLKILDFGLAKVRDLSITRSGERAGTVAYMSPEQLQGEAVDARSDLWSLGVVLYELLTGRLPFGGGHELATVYRILNEEPVPFAQLRSKVPAEVEQLVLRLLQKAPEQRCATAAQVLHDLDAYDAPEALPAGGGGVPSAAVTQRTAEQSTPEFPDGAASPRARGGGRIIVVAMLLALASGAFVFLRERGPTLTEKRILVVPFENQTGDTSLDPIGRMAADWVRQGLGHTGLADVVPGTTVLTSLRYVDSVAVPAGKDRLRALGDETGAGIVLSGALYRFGDSLQFRTEIVDVRQRRLLRALEPITGPVSAPMRAIEQLRERTLAALASLLDERIAGYAHAASQPPSYEAYQDYVAGMERYLARDYDVAVSLFEQAYARDSSYALSLLWQATAHDARTAGNDKATIDSLTRILLPSRERLAPLDQALLDLIRGFVEGNNRRGYEALKRASRLAPGTMMHMLFGCSAMWINRPREGVQVLSQIDMDRGDLRGFWAPWACLAFSYHHLGEHRHELKAVRKGRELYPGDPFLLRHEGMAWAALGRAEEALRVVDALQLLPMAETWAGGDVPIWIARELRAHGYASQARELYNRSVAWYQARPTEGRTCWRATRGNYLVALMGAERWKEAEAVAAALAAQDPENPHCQGYLGVLAARRGDVAEAERVSTRLAEHMPPYQGWLNHYWRARIAAQLGWKQQAVELLRQAFAQGGSMYWWGTYHAEADLEPLHGYPPFEEFMRPKG